MPAAARLINSLGGEDEAVAAVADEVGVVGVEEEEAELEDTQSRLCQQHSLLRAEA